LPSHSLHFQPGPYTAPSLILDTDPCAHPCGAVSDEDQTNTLFLFSFLLWVQHFSRQHPLPAPGPLLFHWSRLGIPFLVCTCIRTLPQLRSRLEGVSLFFAAGSTQRFQPLHVPGISVLFPLLESIPSVAFLIQPLLLPSTPFDARMAGSLPPLFFRPRS